MKELKSKYDLFRQQVHIIIYGTNTVAGRLFDLALLVLILLSVLMVMLETVDKVDQRFHQFLIISEWVITIFFTIEYILRIISIKKPHQYIFSFYGIIDLIAILPMYLSFFVTGTSVLAVVRALRLLRIFRILNLVHFTGQASELKLAIKASRTKTLYLSILSWWYVSYLDPSCTSLKEMQAALRVFLSVFTGVLSPLPRLVMAILLPLPPWGRLLRH